ncbi:MAG: hypothetical protein LBF89_07845 [Bacteroidales bacterium]|jgi:glycerol-3-phosphate cytidylyltransferase-like family protein|nr:hypothetical protein [Bacteroidales bacterium]
MTADYNELIRSKIETNPALMLQQVARWRLREHSTVFVYGNFDGIDGRQLERLAGAAGLGARLIVGIRSDEAVKRIYRYTPRNSTDDRALLLASMIFVSMVVLFEEEHPDQLIQQLHPDILAEYQENINLHPVIQIRRKIKERLKKTNVIPAPYIHARHFFRQKYFSFKKKSINFATLLKIKINK